jgi:hypothetical protein
MGRKGDGWMGRVLSLGAKAPLHEDCANLLRTPGRRQSIGGWSELWLSWRWGIVNSPTVVAVGLDISPSSTLPERQRPSVPF